MTRFFETCIVVFCLATASWAIWLCGRYHAMATVTAQVLAVHELAESYRWADTRIRLASRNSNYPPDPSVNLALAALEERQRRLFVALNIDNEEEE